MKTKAQLEKERKKKAKQKKNKQKKPKTTKSEKKEVDFLMGCTNESPPKVLSLDELWQRYPENLWYEKGEGYWRSVEADENGMLGGLTELKGPDEKDSQEVLKQLTAKDGKYKVNVGCCCDLGAGIGRVTQNVLLHFFENVDLIEQSPVFVKQAEKLLPASCKDRVRPICLGLQDFQPEKGTYDLIWSQWVLGHLRDDQLVNFLERCKVGLRENGVVIVKENISRKGFVMDVEDCSLTRSESHFRHLFERAGMSVLMCKKQADFPSYVFPVHCFVLRGKEVNREEEVGKEKEQDEKEQEEDKGEK